MALFGHHAKAFIDIEIMGHELTPDTGTEHAIFFGVSLLLVVLLVYGAYAGIRDLLRWRRREVRV